MSKRAFPANEIHDKRALATFEKIIERTTPTIIANRKFFVNMCLSVRKNFILLSEIRPMSFPPCGLRAFMIIYEQNHLIKTEKRGSIRAANAINLLVILTFLYKGIGTGYIFNNILAENFHFLQTIFSVVIMILLWCVASWALTTLSSGEGSIREIYITTSYSLMPLVLLGIPVTLASNFLCLDEQSFITFFVFLSFAWAFLLISGPSSVEIYGI